MQSNPGSTKIWRPILGPPPPGSDEALEQMCACAVIDNNYGRGDMGLFWVNEACPLHGTESKKLEMESSDVE